MCGTPPYAAPEVLRAAQRAYRAPPADLWAAALVLLAMLAGGEYCSRSPLAPRRRAVRRDVAARLFGILAVGVFADPKVMVPKLRVASHAPWHGKFVVAG